jgi:hypothetical protein
MHEVIFNILSHKGNASQKCTEVPSHPQSELSSRKQATNADQDARKRNPYYC